MRIAVGNAKHKGKVREFAVAYERTKEEIKLITIHPLKPHQKQHRIESGRWQQI
jgi:precorrin-6B methylase 2